MFISRVFREQIIKAITKNIGRIINTTYIFG